MGQAATGGGGIFLHARRIFLLQMALIPVCNSDADGGDSHERENTR